MAKKNAKQTPAALAEPEEVSEPPEVVPGQEALQLDQSEPDEGGNLEDADGAVEASEPPEEETQPDADGEAPEEKQARTYFVTTVQRVTRVYRVEAGSQRKARALVEQYFDPDSETLEEDLGELVSESLRGGHVHQIRWDREG